MATNFTSETKKFLLNHYETIHILPPDELRSMVVLAQCGDIEAKAIVVESMVKYVFSAAAAHNRPGTEIDDLFQSGIIGLLKAINTFDNSRDNRFITYASIVITNEILLYIRSLKLNKIELDKPISVDSNGNEVYLLDLLPDNIMSLEDRACYLAELEIVRDSLNILSDKLRKIVCMKFGLEGHSRLTQAEIGKVIGCSQAQVSRYLKKALFVIRVFYNDKLR